MPRAARYDAVADFYVTEVGDSVTDEPTTFLLELVGDVQGLAVLDLACGHGRISRELARRGATVTGVDLAGALVAQARELEAAAPLGITYLVGDVSTALPLATGSADLVVCHFGLSDIDDLDGALDTVARVLRPGGGFVFSILHPCFPGHGEDIDSSWQPGRGYFHEGWWRTTASASRIRGAVGANHRTVSTYLNCLTDHGLRLDRLAEPPPPAAWMDRAEPDTDPVPTFLVVRCRRPHH